MSVGCARCVGERLPGGWDTATWAQPPVLSASSIPHLQRTREAVSFWTYEGWLYLAVVLDLFSRRVIGWAMAATQDETLIETALRMALLARRPAAELLFHSDRRSQYTSDAYRAVLAQAGISVSMSRIGNRYDNAVTESFFGTRHAGMCGTQLLPDTQGDQTNHL